MLRVQDDEKNKIETLPHDLNRVGTWQSAFRHLRSTVKQMWEQIVLSGGHCRHTATVIFQSTVNAHISVSMVLNCIFERKNNCSCWTKEQSRHMSASKSDQIDIATTYDACIQTSIWNSPLLNLWTMSAWTYSMRNLYLRVSWILNGRCNIVYRGRLDMAFDFARKTIPFCRVGFFSCWRRDSCHVSYHRAKPSTYEIISRCRGFDTSNNDVGDGPNIILYDNHS